MIKIKKDILVSENLLKSKYGSLNSYQWKDTTEVIERNSLKFEWLLFHWSQDLDLALFFYSLCESTDLPRGTS